MSTLQRLHSLQLSQWLGLGSVRSDMCGDSEYRPFEPTTALCEGGPGI